MKRKNLSLAQVRSLAQKLALRYTKKPTIIGLIGPLGSGKTVFVKAFAHALGYHTVKSPSFTLVHRYALPKQDLYHLDFYRLKRTKELTSLGLSQLLNHRHSVLIEWADRFPKIRNNCDVLIQFTVNPNQTRNVNIQSPKI